MTIPWNLSLEVNSVEERRSDASDVGTWKIGYSPRAQNLKIVRNKSLERWLQSHWTAEKCLRRETLRALKPSKTDAEPGTKINTSPNDQV